jgi:hypothetical protein
MQQKYILKTPVKASVASHTNLSNCAVIQGRSEELDSDLDN